MAATGDLDQLSADIDRAAQLFRFGQAAECLEVLAATRPALEQAHAAGDRDAGTLLATCLLREAAPLFDVTGNLDAALALLDRASLVAVEDEDRALEAKVRGQRALVILRGGDTRRALNAFDHAAELLESAALLDRVIVLVNRGVLHLEHADLDLAADDFRRCYEFARQGEGEEFVVPRGAALQNLAYADFLAGRIPAAIAGLETAVTEYGDNPHPTLYLDQARVLREAGLFDEASEILERAAEIFAAGALFQDLAEAELVRAECALVAGNPQQARDLATSALRRLSRRGNVRWQRKAELLLLRCDDALAEQRLGAARTRALSSLARRAAEYAGRCRAEGRRDLARLGELLAAEAGLRLGRPLEGPPPRLRSTDPLLVRLQIREVRALAELVAGRPARAAAQVRAGLDELGSYQHALGSLDLRTACAVHGGSLSRLGLRVAWDSGSPAAVLELVERARAVSTRLPSVSPPSDDLTAELLGELRQVEEEARGLEGEAPEETRLDQLRVRAAELQHAIRARSWELEGGDGQAVAAPRLGVVREAVRDHEEVFLSFARHEGHWVVVEVDRGRPVLRRLAPVEDVSALVTRVRADLDALAMPMLPAPLRDAVRRSLDRGLTMLDSLLLQGSGTLGRSVVISCSGDLVLLPWGLLPSRLGLPTLVTPSAAAWLAGRRRTRPERPRVVALAGPGLHRSEQEAELVAKHWEGAVVTPPEEADAARAVLALQQSDLVHVAAHGHHRQENPLFSAVRLSDGPLYAYEVDASVGLAGCVVLSACEVGLATSRPGDESLGLAHVLLQLGATSVIGSVARVGDEVAADLMEGVHRAMACGGDSAVALAEAQRAAMLGGSPAAFVAFGGRW